MDCLNCGKELKQIEGKRIKKFCNSTCRSNYWQKEQVLKKGKIKSAKIEKRNGKTTAKITIEMPPQKEQSVSKSPFMNEAIRKKIYGK